MPSLYFDRPEFVHGTMHFEDCEIDDSGHKIIVKKALEPKQKRKRVEISDPDFVLTKYPKWFSKRKPKEKNERL